MADEGKRCKRRASALVPHGLKALLQAMGWAVLMEQPDNICQFLADYTSELLQYKNENPALGQREAIIRFHGMKEETLKVSADQAECSKSDEASGTAKESGKTSPSLSSTSPDIAQEELPTSGLGKTPSLNRQERSEKSGVDPEVEVVHKASLDTAEHLPRPPSKPKRSSSAALKRSPYRKTRKTKHSKSDGEICPQMKQSVALAKSSSLQDFVLMSCEVADKTLQEAPLDREVAVVSDEKSSDGVDSAHLSEVSLTPPEIVPDVELLQEAPLDKAEHLPRPPSKPKRSSSAALKRSPYRKTRKTKHSKSDGEICPQMKQSVALAKSSSLQDCVLMSCEVTDKTLQEAPLGRDVTLMSNEKSSDGVDSSHFSEVSLTPPEIVPDVELLQEAPLDKEDALLSDKKSSDGVNGIHLSEFSLTPPEHVLDQSQAKRRSSAALKRSSGHIKRSKSDGETCGQMKRSVAKSSSLQDCVLMSCEVTDKTLQEAPLDRGAVVSEGESSDGVDSTHLSEVSLTPPELVELLQEAPLDEEVAVVSDEKSSDGVDSAHFSEVSLTPPEIVPDVELLQEAPIDEAEHLPRPPSKPKRSSSAALKRSPYRKTRKAKHSKSDGEICPQMKQSVALAKSSSLQDCVLMSCEVADKTLQEAPLDRDIAVMSDEKSSDGVDSSHFSEVSLTPPEIVPDVELLQEAPLDKEDALLSDEKSSDGVDSTHFSEVSLTPPELVPEVELLQEAPLDKAEHLPRPPSKPKRSSSAALKRPARKTKHSKSDGEIGPQMKQSVALAKSASLQDCVLEAPLDRVKYLASQRTPKREPSARATLPSKRLSSSSSLASSSPSYSRSPSSEESLSDYYGKANVVYMHKEVRRLSPGSSRTSSTAPEKNVSEVKFPPISSPHRRGPDSHTSRKSGLLRSTEKLKLPQIEPRSQRPGPSQDVRARSSEEEDNVQNVAWTLYRLPHRREEGTLSTEVLSQPKYQNGAIIQTIGPGCVVLKGHPGFGSPTDQKRIRGRCYQVSTLDSGQRFTGVNQNSIVIRPPLHRRNDIQP